MSYILDALRRSQAERERGQVPGLDAQLAPAEAPSPARRGDAALWLGVGLGVGGLAALVVWWQRPVAPAVLPVPQAAPAVPAPAPLPRVVSVPPVVVTPSPAPAPSPAPVASPPPAPAAAVPRTLALAELTPEQRRELPPLVMGGSIWSENPQSRFVIVNGQVVREGESAGAGVTVERIAQKAVLFRWRELRFEVPL
jgi:general secretion pathway protein B